MSQPSQAPIMEPEVLVSLRDRTGVIELNRPRAINALTVAMIEAIGQALDQWREDDQIARVELRGAGERGFCSGADVRALREQVLTDPSAALAFFDSEYRLNRVIAEYPKPVHAVMAGITMGGGMGLAAHASIREATASTQLAMPETTIGLFPDVGVNFELSRMPGQTGTHLALSGVSVDASSALWAGLVTQSDELAVHPQDSQLSRQSTWIDQCYVGDDPVAILAALDAHADPQANQAAALIRTKCPLSVAVALEAIRRAQTMSPVAQVLDQDRVLAHHFVRDSDFAEGVRAQLVDKDRTPRWRHASLAQVSRAEVLAMFDASILDQA